jgi:hypothetical protein
MENEDKNEDGDQTDIFLAKWECQFFHLDQALYKMLFRANMTCCFDVRFERPLCENF